MNNDYPNSISNKIPHLFMNEATYVLSDGVVSLEDEDEILKVVLNIKCVIGNSKFNRSRCCVHSLDNFIRKLLRSRI